MRHSEQQQPRQTWRLDEWCFLDAAFFEWTIQYFFFSSSPYRNFVKATRGMPVHALASLAPNRSFHYVPRPLCDSTKLRVLLFYRSVWTMCKGANPVRRWKNIFLIYLLLTHSLERFRMAKPSVPRAHLPPTMDAARHQVYSFADIIFRVIAFSASRQHELKMFFISINLIESGWGDVAPGTGRAVGPISLMWWPLKTITLKREQNDELNFPWL